MGCKKDIKLPRSVISLTIPAGAESGDKHRIRGKGVKDVNYSDYGDFYIIISDTFRTLSYLKIFTYNYFILNDDNLSVPFQSL